MWRATPRHNEPALRESESQARCMRQIRSQQNQFLMAWNMILKTYQTISYRAAITRLNASKTKFMAFIIIF